MKTISRFPQVIPLIFNSGKFILTFLLFSLIFFLASAGFYFYSNYTSWGKAAYYEKMAEKLPPTSLQAKRYRAIAEAIKQGKTTYTFEAGRIPALGGQ